MRIAILIVLTTWAASCGQKGPLELPPDASASIAAASVIARHGAH